MEQPRKAFGMNYGSYRFWAILNALLALGILILLVCLLLGRSIQAKNAHSGPVPASAQPMVSFAIHREMSVQRTGMREVCFAPLPPMPDAAEVWRARGVQAQEWARLPASPGMDMLERPDAYLLAFSLPGVRDEDIRLTVTDQVVSVQAVVRDLAGNPVGDVARHVRLPQAPGNPAECRSCFSNGILRVCVAK